MTWRGIAATPYPRARAVDGQALAHGLAAAGVDEADALGANVDVAVRGNLVVGAQVEIESQALK